MKNDPQGADNYRKKPKQSRSAQTIGLIFEATAQILQGERKNNFNTNAIAEVAGISVGTLYQYFPNKDAILLAMAAHELEKVTEQISKILLSSSVQDKEELGKIVVHALLQGFGGRQKMRKLLLEAIMESGLSSQLHKPIEKVLTNIFVHANIPHLATMPPIRQYVMAHSLVSIIRIATLEQSDYLDNPEFEQELVRLFCSFF